MSGDRDRALRLLAADRGAVRAEARDNARQGLAIHRVRVVEQPVPPYLQWELNALRMPAEEGSGLRILRAEHVKNREKTRPASRNRDSGRPRARRGPLPRRLDAVRGPPHHRPGNHPRRRGRDHRPGRRGWSRCSASSYTGSPRRRARRWPTARPRMPFDPRDRARSERPRWFWPPSSPSACAPPASTGSSTRSTPGPRRSTAPGAAEQHPPRQARPTDIQQVPR